MKIYIKVFGCTANKADAEVMKELLKKEHQLVNSEKEAQLLIVLTCGVKGSTENKILNYLSKIKNSKVIIAGCLTKIISKTLEKSFPNFSLIGPDQVGDILKIVNEIREGKRVIELSEKKCPFITYNSKEKIQPILVAQGCLGNCTYCATKLARGNLKSRSIDEIKKAVETALKNGANKIYLTAQDMGVYGLDINTNLVNLLKELVQIPGTFKIRVGMMNPKYAKLMSKELVEIFKNPKIIKFLHIPVQSGNNQVLKDMGRNYTVKDFVSVVNLFRKEIPDITISTDIICGFPTESEKQFEDTLKLIKKIKPQVLNFTKFYARPGTKAKTMKQLPNDIIKERSRKVFELFKKIKQGYLNK